MINNFDLLSKFITPETEDDFWFVQILKRKKEHLEKIRLANIGKKRSEEVRKQIIINLTNRKLSKEQIKTIKEHNYKQVIDTITGVIYVSLMDASEKIGIKYSYLCKMVKGKVKNKTNLIYYHAR